MTWGYIGAAAISGVASIVSSNNRSGGGSRDDEDVPGGSNYVANADVGGYEKSAYSKDYWSPNAEENKYLSRNLSQLAEDYGAAGNQVKGELNQQGVGTAGTLGQFAMGQRVAKPYALAQANLYNNQYNQRAAGEQSQLSRQGDFTQGANKMGLDQAIANNNAAIDIYKEQEETRRQNATASDATMGAVGTGVGSMFNTYMNRNKTGTAGTPNNI